MDVYYPGIAAGDSASIGPDGTVSAVVTPNAIYQVFELADTTFSSPLTIKTPAGLTDTKVPVGALPIFPDVYVVSPNFAHNWKSGSFVFRRDSQDAKDKAVADAVVAAQGAVSEVQRPADEAVDAGIIRADIPSVVTRTVAAAPTVTSAAAQAVDAELASAAILRGVTPTGADLSFSIGDQNGRRSWFEIATDGGLTKHTAEEVARSAAPILIGEGLVPLPKEISDGAGYSYVITDKDGRMSELRLDLEGKFAGPFPDRVIAAAVAATGSASGLVAKLPIASWSDSMGAFGSGYADYLAAETGVECRIYGIGGQGSGAIAARQGGVPATAKFPNDTIPASGTVTLESISIQPYTSPAGTGTSSGHVSIAGVPGTLTRDNPTNAHTFTRDTAGSAVWCPSSTPIITDEAALNRAQVSLIWSGRNSVLFDTPENIVGMIQQMVGYLVPAEKRFLVMEVTPINTETAAPTTANRTKVETLNASLRKAFPHNYVPVSQYMRGPALADAGITPTAQDQADFTAGVVPTSLMADTVHFNAAGRQLVARLIAKHLRLKGWIP